MCHAEGRTTAAILLLAELADRPVHIAHVARKEEVRAKKPGYLISIPLPGMVHSFLVNEARFRPFVTLQKCKR